MLYMATECFLFAYLLIPFILFTTYLYTICVIYEHYGLFIVFLIDYGFAKTF